MFPRIRVVFTRQLVEILVTGLQLSRSTGNPGFVIVPQYVSSKITVFVRGNVKIVKSLTQVNENLLCSWLLLFLMLTRRFVICSNSLSMHTIK